MTNIAQHDINHFKGYIDFLIDKKKDFVIKTTNYTKKVEIGDKESVTLFTEGTMNNRVFAFNKKIRKEIKESNIIIDDIDEKIIDYYSISKRVTNKRFLMPKEVINIDLKSAYITVLFNAGLISKETFDKISKLPKLERLQCVGMLATTKQIMKFQEGKLVDQSVEKDLEARKYFFYCCWVISQLMKGIAEEYKDKFLFHWVDGIYFSADADINKAIEIVKFFKFDFKIEKLEESELSFRKKTAIFTYLKSENKKKKIICVPIEDEKNKKERIKFLNYLKSKKNGK